MLLLPASKKNILLKNDQFLKMSYIFDMNFGFSTSVREDENEKGIR
jgi:hypothetical protein